MTERLLDPDDSECVNKDGIIAWLAGDEEEYDERCGNRSTYREDE